jgi:hypothetical protein
MPTAQRGGTRFPKDALSLVRFQRGDKGFAMTTGFSP